MAFVDTDLYLTSGTNVLARGDWTDTVYKYDSSSFYNWEQDNLPLYDLEERTELNWEQHGYAGSSLQGGMMLTVSDSGADTAAPYQVFSSVSGALEKLPRVLRFPVIIEVAASGDLGDVNISDFEFVDDGGLEIVNRGFGKLLSGSSTTSFSTAASGTNTSSISHVSSLDLSNTFANASALATSSNLTTINTNDYWNTYHRSFFRILTTYSLDGSLVRASMGDFKGGPTSNDHRPNGLTATVKQGTIDGAGFLTGDGNTFGLDDYLDQASGLDYNATAGSFALRESDTANLDAFNQDVGVGGFVYANTIRSLKIQNCNGPVYVRGFCVDGYRGETIPAPDHEIETGITVKNSKVVIENCAVMRCSETGLLVENSDVILNRGFTSYRNYPLASDTKGTASAYGMRTFNSTVTLSATNDEALGMPADAPFSFLHNPVGVQLNNSTLTSPVGGRTRNIVDGAVATAQYEFHQINLDLFLNTEVGLESNNSVIDFNHSIFAFQNQNGIKLFNSKLHTDELIIDHNNNVGLESDGSDIQFFKVGNATNGAPNKVFQTVINGIHLKLRNSSLGHSELNTEYRGTTTVPANFVEICAGGRKTENGLTLPGVQLDNSKVRLLNAKTEFDTTNHTPASLEGVPLTGFSYLAENGSKLQFLGTSGDHYTYIQGPDTSYNTLLDSVAVMAQDNSIVEFNGPTVMNSAGINVGARNHSTILFQPHNTDGRLEITDWSLSDSSMHTMVDLQSYKSCLSVDNNSTLKMKDCGDFNELWGRSSDQYVLDLVTSSDYNPADVLGHSTYTSGGYIQFYPNPIIRGLGVGDTEFVCSANQVTSLDAPGMANTNTSGDRIPDTVSDKQDFWDYSWGGVCVRATGGSNVEVLNTHFLTGFNNVSSTILDVSAGAPLTTECGKVMIWNIADESSLRASHISVSGHYPGDVNYHGPSGFYVSADSTCNGNYTVLSSAPSGTEDTGRISILDSFGQHPEVNDLQDGASSIAARDTFDNKGPFRLYFSVNPVANYIGYTRGTNGAFQLSSNLDAGYVWSDAPSAVEVGEPYQEISQGYNPSRDCSTPYPANLSSIFEELGFQLDASAGGQPLSTTFFYASGMLDDSYASRIWLDDSAMNTFANAKNATKGTSGRSKLVSYYRATKEEFGEGHTGDEGNDAGGFRNGFGLGFRSSNISDFDRDV